MQQNSDAPLIMVWPLLASLAGLAFCAWTAYGNAFDICFSAGCSISKDISIGGISLWWFGCAAFALLVILSFSGRPVLGVVVSGICLVADVGLLVLMLLTASCVSCLVVAVLFAICYSAFRHAKVTYDVPVPRSWLILFWGLFLIANMGSVVRENMLPWAIKETANSTVNVYFSPTCPSCLDAVATMSASPAAAFFPISKNEQDVAIIALMEQNLENGLSAIDALSLARQKVNMEPAQNFFGQILLRFRLLINAAYLARNGIEVVPVIEYKGLPGFLAPKAGVDTSYKAPIQPALGVVAKESKSAETSKGEAEKQAASLPHVPYAVGRIAPGALVVPKESKPEHVMGRGAFTYTGTSSGASSAGSVSANLPFDTGVVGACGGADTAPCP